VPSERVERKLAAILAADVAGYSRLMGADETGTLARLKAHRRELIDPKIAEHRGRVVKTTGDGILIEFPSVVEALGCAVDVQRGMAECNAEVPEDKRITFRVGINLGDIIVEGDDIYGDGVNVAARLQELAQPGGICVSRTVRDQVRDKVPFSFEDLGERTVKNIARPLRVFRVSWDVPGASGGQAVAEPTRPALSLPDKPSIAVLPFQNLSDDPEQEYFADGITEDITTALARFRWFFVIARNSSYTYKGKVIEVKQVAGELGVRYVLEGSVRRSGKRIRITAQLIDAVAGTHIWAERYDRDLTDIFDVQDEITEQVAGAIEPELLKTEGLVAISRTESLSAWDLVRQGMWHFHRVTRETHWRARELFRRAVKLDSKLPEGHIWLARVNAGLGLYGWTEDPESDLREGMRAALSAVQLDERNPYSHYALAIISVFSNELEQSIRAAEKAIELSPSFALGHLVLGMAQLFAGRPEAAIEPLEHGIRLSPFDPQNFVWFQVLSLAEYFAGDRGAALQAALRALKVRPSWRPTLELLALCYAALDRLDEARTFVGQIHHLERPPGDVFAQMKGNNSEWAADMAAMLEKAGLRT
jgi:adenylate cyclase